MSSSFTLKKGQHLHFIGIGGCSMNGLAMIMHHQGYTITGSDRVASAFTDHLESLGIKVYIGHEASQIEGADAIVYSAAIKPTNPEMAAALAKGIPTIERSVLLGMISGHFKEVIGIAGCHGKTTITSMLGLILLKAQKDPTVHVGGEVEFLTGGTRVGHSGLFVTEACEYVRSFLTLHPTIEVINNIDDDHLDCYKDIEEIASVFDEFIHLMPKTGVFVANIEDWRVAELVKTCPVRTVTYALDEKADYQAQHIEYDGYGHPSFTVLDHGKPVQKIQLGIPGRHNVQNALAAIAVARQLGVPYDCIADALAKYRLVARRFEFFGEKDGVKLFHDYAHHPSEIRSCLQAAKQTPHKKLWCIFQCNSYTRAKTLMEKYGKCFEDADEVLVPDIYPGRDIDTGIVHARDLVAEIAKNGTKVEYLPTFEEIRDYLHAHWQFGDLVVAVGSGDVFKKVRIVLE